MLNPGQVKELLDYKAAAYNDTSFIENDPVSIPHLFSLKEDIEISGFLAASISWGQRSSILNSAGRLMEKMDHSPFEFVVSADEKDFKVFDDFVHRTFNGADCRYFIISLKNIYLNHGGLESIFTSGVETGMKPAIGAFRDIFFSLPHESRTEKHVANPFQGSAAKRINMFLRWMVRKDDRGVDFGIWNNINPSRLYCPLDVHTGNVARKLGLISRKQNDWKALEELMVHLRDFDPEDPVKYDFALFGMGIFEKF
jgi:uncharacterized protein (TIGR02757 family)